VHVYESTDWTLLGPHDKPRGIANGGLGSDGSALLVPQGSRGIDVYQLS
jgi:hypothetical protein